MFCHKSETGDFATQVTGVENLGNETGPSEKKRETQGPWSGFLKGSKDSPHGVDSPGKDCKQSIAMILILVKIITVTTTRGFFFRVCLPH